MIVYTPLKQYERKYDKVQPMLQPQLNLAVRNEPTAEEIQEVPELEESKISNPLPRTAEKIERSEQQPTVPEELKKPIQRTTIKKMFDTKEQFINTMTPIYEGILASKGINPEFAKYLVAQDAHESGWGKHISGKNNFGGIKGKGQTLKTQEFENGEMKTVYDSFRDFDTIEDYARYKVNLLNNTRYRAFDDGTENFFTKVYRGGYATDPEYVNKLNRVFASV